MFDVTNKRQEDGPHASDRILQALLQRMLPLLALFLLTSSCGVTAELKKHTIEVFQLYVQLTEARMESELSNPDLFLYFDSLPEQQRDLWREQLTNGQIMVRSVETRQSNRKISVPDGLIHHWVALVFMPGVDLKQVVTFLQDYDHHQSLYKPDIQRSQLLSREDQSFKVYLRLYRKAVVTAVYNAEFAIQYFPLNATREYSRMYSTRIAEVEHPGTAEEREKPVGNDRGFLWRLYMYTRFEEKDGGTYMQIEFIALSRSVPAIFAWLVNPYIKSIPREYLSNFLKVTRRELTSSKTLQAPVVAGYYPTDARRNRLTQVRTLQCRPAIGKSLGKLAFWSRFVRFRNCERTLLTAVWIGHSLLPSQCVFNPFQGKSMWWTLSHLEQTGLRQSQNLKVTIIQPPTASEFPKVDQNNTEGSGAEADGKIQSMKRGELEQSAQKWLIEHQPQED